MPAQGHLLFIMDIISLTAAPVGDVITPTVFGMKGSFLLTVWSKSPSSESLFLSCS
jgi:hypothetical protein